MFKMGDKLRGNYQEWRREHSVWAGIQFHHLTFIMETVFVAALQPGISSPGNLPPLESLQHWSGRFYGGVSQLCQREVPVHSL